MLKLQLMFLAWAWDKVTDLVARKDIKFAMILHDIAHEDTV